MKCARCGRKVTPAEAVYSSTRRVHYCGPADWKKCDKKYKQRQALDELTRMSQDLPGGYR